VSTAFFDDHPANALLAVSHQNDNAPIVIGHDGHGSWSAHHVGDITTKLLRHADVPVIVTNAATGPEGLDGPILVGLNGPTPQVDAIFEWAARLGATFNKRHPPPKVTTSARKGLPATTLDEAARDIGASMIVMGNHHHGTIASIFGAAVAGQAAIETSRPPPSCMMPATSVGARWASAFRRAVSPSDAVPYHMAVEFFAAAARVNLDPIRTRISLEHDMDRCGPDPWARTLD
jgi:nucleotide-binding universal stress UspA family protein